MPAAKKVTTKRAAQAAPAAPAEKKPKVDPTFKGINDALKQAADLPEPVRNMLLAAVPKAFEAPCNERHATQSVMIKMIGDVMDGIVSKLQEAVNTEGEQVTGAEARKSELEGAVANAETRQTEAAEVVETRKSNLAELTKAMQAAKAAVQESEVAQKTGDAAIVKSREEKAAIESVMSTSLATILEGESEDTSELYQALMPYVQDMGLDESLMSALPSSCRKTAAARGSFDKMVLDQIGTSFKTKLAELTKVVEEAAPAAEERAAAVASAQTELEAAQAAQVAAAEGLNVATTEEQASTAAVASAKDALAAYAVEFAEAAKVRDEKVSELENFKVYNVGCFELLRDRMSAPANAGA